MTDGAWGAVRWALVPLADVSDEPAAAWLTPLERERAARLGSRRRLAFLAGRTALRRVAHEALGVSDEPLETLREDGEKPTLRARGRVWSASISHDRQVAVAALALAGRVGVDVEEPRGSLLTAQGVYASDGEARLQAPGLGPIDVALRVWTTKEAVSKLLDIPFPELWAGARVVAVGPRETAVEVGAARLVAAHVPLAGRLMTLVADDGAPP